MKPLGDASFRIGVAAEDGTCAQAAQRLADRVLRECEPWIDDDETLSLVRTLWTGPDPGYLELKECWKRARSARLPIYGHFGKTPGELDASMYRACIYLVEHLQPDLTLLIIARDLDRRPEKRHGFEQARRTVPAGQPIVFAGMEPCAEAYYLVGFIPESADEARRLEELRSKWSLDPTREPERLPCRKPEDRSAKRALEVLTDGDCTRRARCLDVDLAHLERHEGSGLSAYLHDLRRALGRRP